MLARVGVDTQTTDRYEVNGNLNLPSLDGEEQFVEVWFEGK